MNIEDRNYYNDFRVLAGEKPKLGFNEARNTVTVSYYDYDNDGDEIFVELPAKYEVCPTCDGKGKHVNPSIDCGGLSGEDFAEDPEFAENYFSGFYDVCCYECNGKRVVPEIDEEACEKNNELKEALEAYYSEQQSLAEMDRISRMDRMNGA